MQSFSASAISRCSSRRYTHALFVEVLGLRLVATCWLARALLILILVGSSVAPMLKLAGYTVGWLPADDSLAMWLAGGLTMRWVDWLAHWLVAHSVAHTWLVASLEQLRLVGWPDGRWTGRPDRRAGWLNGSMQAGWLAGLPTACRLGEIMCNSSAHFALLNFF